MILSKTLKNSLLALVVVSTTGSSLALRAEEAKSPSKRSAVTVTIPSAKTALKYGFKFGEEILPYISLLAYFSYVSPRITNALLTVGTKKTEKESTNKDGKNTKEIITSERFNIAGMQKGLDETIKLFLGVWFADRIKKHAEFVKDTVASGREYLLGA